MSKGNKGNYGNYIIDNKEQLLRKKRKRIVMKRSIIFLILLLGILITLGLTLPVFNLQKVVIEGNNKVAVEEVEALAAVPYNKNIFKLGLKEIKSNVLQNPYISDVSVKRKIPNTLIVNIKERERAYYITGEGGAYIIDEYGTVLEKKEKNDDPLLLKLEGIGEENLIVGEKIKNVEEDDLKALGFIYEFINENKILEKYGVSKVEINDFISLKLYVNNLYIKIGTTDDLFNKLSRGFNVLNNPDMAAMKGYIDVSFDGNPVVYKE